MLVGKQADGEGMALGLGLRDVTFNYQAVTPATLNRERQKRLDRGTYLEAGTLWFLGPHHGGHPGDHYSYLVPLASVPFSVLTALITIPIGNGNRESPGAVTGWVFLQTASCSILVVSHSPQGLEEIYRLLSSRKAFSCRTTLRWLAAGTPPWSSLKSMKAKTRRIRGAPPRRKGRPPPERYTRPCPPRSQVTFRDGLPPQKRPSGLAIPGGGNKFRPWIGQFVDWGAS